MTAPEQSNGAELLVSKRYKDGLPTGKHPQNPRCELRRGNRPPARGNVNETRRPSKGRFEPGHLILQLQSHTCPKHTFCILSLGKIKLKDFLEFWCILLFANTQYDKTCWFCINNDIPSEFMTLFTQVELTINDTSDKSSTQGVQYTHHIVWGLYRNSDCLKHRILIQLEHLTMILITMQMPPEVVTMSV